MKILQINKFYYARRGAETYFLDLIDLLQQHGHEVAVFACDHPQSLPTPYKKYFAPYLELNQAGGLSGTQKVLAAKRTIWNQAAAAQLEKLLQDFKPDVAHVHNIYHQLSPSILRVLKRHNIPVVMTLHDYKLLCPNYSLFTENKVCQRCQGHRYYNAVRHRCLQQSRSASAVAMIEMYVHKFLQVYEQSVDCFISPSVFLYDLVKQWQEPVKRIEVLPNFIVAPAQLTATTSTSFLYAGALLPEKGVDVLLDIFTKYRYSRPLIIAGDGPLQTRMPTAIQQAKAIGNTIIGLGKISKQDLQEQLNKALAVLVPSRYYENYPYAVLEAFAAGKPVIGANRGGIPELVKPGETGWLAEVADPIDLTSWHEALMAAEQNPQQAQHYGQQAWQSVRQHNDPQHHYQQLLSIYESVVS